jgi:hypothetical protein
MQKDNTLGAPTEGLGQTVTFAAGGVGVPQAQAEQRGALRAGITGQANQMTSRAMMVPEVQPDATFTALAKLGGDLLAPHIKAERDASFMRGAQQAASQQAITEIVDEQPWYSKLFGTTSLVDGARAYSSVKVANDISNSIEQDMPNIRRMTDEQFTEHTNKLLNSRLTGDQATDMMIQQQTFSMLPHIMKARTKANIAYKGEVLTQSISEAAGGVASALGLADQLIRQGDGTKEEADTIPLVAKLSEVMQRPETIDKAHFDKTLTDQFVKQIRSGNFALADLLDGSSFTNELTAEQQHKLALARHQATLDARAKLPEGYAARVAYFRGMSNLPGVTEADISAYRKGLQADYEKATGDKRAFISNEELSREFEQRNAKALAYQQHLANEAKRLGRDDLKVAQRELEVANHALRITAPSAKSEYLNNLESKLQQEVFAKVATLPPDQRMHVLAKQADVDVLDESFRDELRQRLHQGRRENNPELVAQGMEMYNSIVKYAGDNGDVLAQKYAGKELSTLASRWREVSKGQPPTPQTIQMFYSYAALPGGEPVNAKQDAELIDEVKTGRVMSALSAVGRVIGMDTFPISNYEEVAGLLKRRQNSSIKDPVMRSRSALELSEDITVIGGYGYEKSTQATDMTKYLRGLSKEVGGVDASNINRAARSYFDKTVSDLRIDGDFKLVQLPDTADKVPRLAIWGFDSASQLVIHTFTGNDIAANWKNKPAVNSAKVATQYKQVHNEPSLIMPDK